MKNVSNILQLSEFVQEHSCGMVIIPYTYYTYMLDEKGNLIHVGQIANWIIVEFFRLLMLDI